MTKVSYQGRKLYPVDARVRDRLRAVAERHARRGVRIFVFGSVARTWPNSYAGADLDLGYEIEPSRGDRDQLRRDLERDLESLPSIRPIDLVDFSAVDGAFRHEAEKHVVELAHERVDSARDAKQEVGHKKLKKHDKVF